jgi:hypothetical protein
MSVVCREYLNVVRSVWSKSRPPLWVLAVNNQPAITNKTKIDTKPKMTSINIYCVSLYLFYSLWLMIFHREYHHSGKWMIWSTKCTGSSIHEGTLYCNSNISIMYPMYCLVFPFSQQLVYFYMKGWPMYWYYMEIPGVNCTRKSIQFIFVCFVFTTHVKRITLALHDLT